MISICNNHTCDSNNHVDKECAAGGRGRKGNNGVSCSPSLMRILFHLYRNSFLYLHLWHTQLLNGRPVHFHSSINQKINSSGWKRIFQSSDKIPVQLNVGPIVAVQNGLFVVHF
jgi:hypothetical protein